MLEALQGLPSRGTLQQESGIPVVLQPAPKRYLADHQTAPPETQKLEAKTTTELLVSLQQNKKREAAKQKQESGKRPASGNAEPGPSSKRQQTEKDASKPTTDGQPNHQTLQYTIQQLQTKNLKELMEIVKAKGGTVKGRKDQLITRIVGLQKGKQKA
ncbi:hypothetical protein WJX74_006186 [Apatococcus lobatus]|uniref:DET1- and DDB1-associated protein 1 n=1 Tax=Apatococcus lobatus TaxID=904363 RepID=A0AAW1S6X2_9CHLO